MVKWNGVLFLCLFSLVTGDRGILIQSLTSSEGREMTNSSERPKTNNHHHNLFGALARRLKKNYMKGTPNTLY